MGVRPTVAILLLVSLAFAGCSSGGGGGASSTSSSSHATSSSASASHSNTTAPAPNHAPTGTVWSLPSGLNVTFGLDGSDSDGDALSWTLAFGDGKGANGTALPANVTHPYAAAGAYNATFTLSDGRNETAYNVTVRLDASAALAPVTFTGHVVAPDANENGEGECLFALLDSTGAPPGWGGIAGDSFTLDGDYAGWAFGFDVDGMVAQFQDAAGYAGDKAASGSVPDGATGVLACSHSAVNTDYTLTLTPP